MLGFSLVACIVLLPIANGFGALPTPASSAATGDSISFACNSKNPTLSFQPIGSQSRIQKSGSQCKLHIDVPGDYYVSDGSSSVRYVGFSFDYNQPLIIASSFQTVRVQDSDTIANYFDVQSSDPSCSVRNNAELHRLEVNASSSTADCGVQSHIANINFFKEPVRLRVTNMVVEANSAASINITGEDGDESNAVAFKIVGGAIYVHPCHGLKIPAGPSMSFEAVISHSNLTIAVNNGSQYACKHYLKPYQQGDRGIQVVGNRFSMEGISIHSELNNITLPLVLDAFGNLLNLPVPQIGVDQQPNIDIGFVDVTLPPFSADPTGQVDATKQLQRAFDFATRHQVAFN